MTAQLFSVVIITWNLASENPPANLDLMPLLRQEPQPDLYVIGVQEMGASFKTYWERVPRILDRAGYKLHSNEALSYWAVTKPVYTGIYMFVKRNTQLDFSNVGVDTVTTGLFNVFGNKGAATICTKISQISTCFINAHLAAHEKNTEKRIEDISRIEGKSKIDLRDPNTLVFWFGDLNFRLKDPQELPVETIIDHLKRTNWREIFAYDELNDLKQNGRVFGVFKEREVTFPPTFKYIKGADHYKDQRRPAWTDRILYKDEMNIVEPEGYYSSVPEVKLSDHRPVVAYFKIKRQ